MRHPAHVPAEPEHDLVELLKKMRYDLTQLQGRLSEALRQARAMDLPEPDAYVCPNGLCGLQFRSATRLAEHVYVSHAGPVPAHYAAIEARSEA
jgi:hypothetical protein